MAAVSKTALTKHHYHSKMERTFVLSVSPPRLLPPTQNVRLATDFHCRISGSSRTSWACLAAGSTGGVVLQLPSALHAFRQQSVSHKVQMQRAEAKRQRETIRFFNYKTRMFAMRGLQPRSDEEWDAVERLCLRRHVLLLASNLISTTTMRLNALVSKVLRSLSKILKRLAKSIVYHRSFLKNLERCG